MALIFKIAWRNVLRHRTKSFIIGIILFIGALLMTLGNAVIAGMNAGLERNIVDGFMGDLVVISSQQENDNILLDMMGRATEPLYGYPAIKKVLLAQPEIEKVLPAGKNGAMAISEESGSFVYLLGVDFPEYQKMFPNNIHPIEGRLFHAGEKAVMVPEFIRKEYYGLTGVWLYAQGAGLVETNLTPEAQAHRKELRSSDNVVYLGFNEDNTARDIRLGISGIIRYRAMNQIFGHFNLVDIDSYRECLGYFSAEEMAVEVPQASRRLLEMGSEKLDDLFESDSMMVANDRGAGADEVKLTPVKGPARKAPADVELGAYNVVFVKLKAGTPYEPMIKKLNDQFTRDRLGVRVTTWKKASGIIGSMSVVIKVTLFLFVMFLFFVAIIIIINTLTMTALERTSEIGMMRAIGARKGFISGMFLGETAILSFVFGGAGIVCGLLLVQGAPLLNLTTSNDILQILYGGERFSPRLSIPDILLSLTQLVFVTILAMLYPVKVAKNITPLDAIMRD